MFLVSILVNVLLRGKCILDGGRAYWTGELAMVDLFLCTLVLGLPSFLWSQLYTPGIYAFTWFFGIKNKRKKEIKKTWRKWSVYLEWEELCCSGPAMMTLSAILCAAILHAVMLTQSGKVVFRGSFLIKLTLAPKKEETQKQAYSFSLLPAKS